MKDTNTTTAANASVADRHCAAQTHDCEPDKNGKSMANSIKHAAHATAKEARALGGEINTAGKGILNGAKDMCDCTEKAVLKATDKALRATSHATAKASRSVRKTIQTNAEGKE